MGITTVLAVTLMTNTCFTLKCSRIARMAMLGVALLVPLLSQVAQAAPRLTHISIERLRNGHEVLKLNASSNIKLRQVFTLSNPSRVAIDLETIQPAKLPLPTGYQGVIRSIRSAQFNPNTWRIVLEVTAPVTVVASKSGNPISIEIAPTGKAEPPAKPVAAEKPSKKSAKRPAETPSKVAESGSARETPVIPEATKPMIIIDAGHGGQDPGAIGLHGTHEKDITLSYARALREALLRTGRYRVGMTREDDHFVPLTERVAIARKFKGALFISFHADSNPKPEARGLSIYTLSENASDDEAAALAERENKADIISGIDLNTTDKDVANVLIDLTQRETMNKSAEFADKVVAALRSRISTLDRTHRYAGFRVLKGPDIPSVLIELGFVTNPQDERMLLTQDYRDRVVGAVVNGIGQYLTGK